MLCYEIVFNPEHSSGCTSTILTEAVHSLILPATDGRVELQLLLVLLTPGREWKQSASHRISCHPSYFSDAE